MNKPVTAIEVKVFVRNAEDGDKLRSGDRSGLYIMRRGDHFYWRYDFRQTNGKRSTTEFGTYPAIGLGDARKKLEAFKVAMRSGVYPSTRRAEREAKKRSGKPFSELVTAYLGKRGATLKPATLDNVASRFRNYILPELGKLPVEMVGIDDMRRVLLEASESGSPLQARRLVRDVADLVKFSKASGFMASIALDDVRAIADALPKVGVTEHRRAVTSPEALADVLRRIESIPATSLVGVAARLIPHVYVRVETLVAAPWSEFDLAGRCWHIPGTPGRMKGVRGKEPALDIPLSDPVLEILAHLKTMQEDGEPYLFPGSSKSGHMDVGTIGKVLKRFDIPTTVHGFRGTASTLLREIGGFSDDLVERSLGHNTGNAVARAYDHSSRLQQRRVMLDWWSDYLIALRDGKPVPVSPMADHEARG